MQFHNLKKNSSNRKSKQVGRGGTRGKTSGRGTKGQNARAGRKKRPEMRDIIKRLPKLRGRGKNFLKSRFDENSVVTLSQLESNFSAGDTINVKALAQKGLISLKSGKMPSVKILGSDKIKKTFNFERIKLSESARKSVISAGGKIS